MNTRNAEAWIPCLRQWTISLIHCSTNIYRCCSSSMWWDSKIADFRNQTTISKAKRLKSFNSECFSTHRYFRFLDHNRIPSRPNRTNRCSRICSTSRSTSNRWRRQSRPSTTQIAPCLWSDKTFRGASRKCRSWALKRGQNRKRVIESLLSLWWHENGTCFSHHCQWVLAQVHKVQKHKGILFPCQRCTSQWLYDALLSNKCEN